VAVRAYPLRARASCTAASHRRAGCGKTERARAGLGRFFRTKSGRVKAARGGGGGRGVGRRGERLHVGIGSIDWRCSLLIRCLGLESRHGAAASTGDSGVIVGGEVGLRDELVDLRRFGHLVDHLTLRRPRDRGELDCRAAAAPGRYRRLQRNSRRAAAASSGGTYVSLRTGWCCPTTCSSPSQLASSLPPKSCPRCAVVRPAPAGASEQSQRGQSQRDRASRDHVVWTPAWQATGGGGGSGWHSRVVRFED
jgi:hypothetical protein